MQSSWLKLIDSSVKTMQHGIGIENAIPSSFTSNAPVKSDRLSGCLQMIRVLIEL
jgi:hypothetical protein